jgi:hypothetical protein
MPMSWFASEAGPLIAHLVGDFILQNEWMAREKKRSSFACLVHVAVYMVPFLLCTMAWWQFTLIAVQHFAQDRTGFVFWWMRVWKRVHPDYWGAIGLFVDQAFHLTWIAIVLSLDPLVELILS